jgi:hypothetical protein
MTDKTKDDIVKGEEEALAPPTPEISAGSEQAGSEKVGFDAEAFESRFFEKLDEVLDKKVDARVKSIKDRRLNKLAKAEEILAAVEAAGGDPEKIRGKLETDSLLNRLEALEAAISGAGGSAPAGGARVSQEEFDKKTAEILEEAGIPVDDEEVKELAKTKVANEGEWYRKLTALAVKRAKQGGITSSATVGKTGKTASTDKTYDELAAELAELKKKGSSRENMIRQREILQQMGTPLDSPASGGL